MKRGSFVLIAMWLFTIPGQTQNSAGKCWNIDYLLWNQNQPQLHIDCGNDDAFNIGDELTLEFWIRAYTFGENRKVLGKVDSDGSVFNNGYVLGFENLNPYAEIWNPTLQQIPYPSAGPIPQDSAFVHIACTYSSATAKLSDYLNGELIGQVDVFPPNAIVTNDAVFLIGAAPWGTDSFQFYGSLDEVRVWNKARTAAQLKEFMFKELKGDEEGLVAYYNFNNAHDSIVPDESINDNQGALRNSEDPSWSWIESFVPVGDEKMYNMLDPVGAWYGKSPELWDHATTNNGLSIITEIGEKVFNKYLVFGHTGSSGINTNFAPENAPEDFQRISREWYVNSGGILTTDFYFNLEQAAAGSDQLPSSTHDTSYVLLTRSNETENFTAVLYPSDIIGNILVFNNVPLHDQYYCIAYCATRIPVEPDGVEEIQKLQQIKMGPNPTNGQLVVQNGKGITVRIYDSSGNLMLTKVLQNYHEIIDTQNLKTGMYMIQYQYKNSSISKKIVVKQ